MSIPTARRLALSAVLACSIPAANAASPLALVHAPHRDGPPVIALVAQKSAVLADLVVPYGVLAQSGVATLVVVDMADGPIDAGAAKILPDMTADAFDRAYPEGADYVIVPATADHHGRETAWLRAQHAHGAALVSICDGVEVVADTGALDGRQATGHWASSPNRRKARPQVHWRSDVRYVADGDVASSAGVSAALPISLALVEAIAGPQVAQATADRLGVAAWDDVHDSGVFAVRRDDIAVHKANMRAKPDVVALAVHPDDDAVAFALHAEAWSRTMRSDVHVVSDDGGVVRLHGGLRVATEAAATVQPDVHITLDTPSAGRILDEDLERIADRYGAGTARLAALGMEYPWGDLKPRR